LPTPLIAKSKQLIKFRRRGLRYLLLLSRPRAGTRSELMVAKLASVAARSMREKVHAGPGALRLAPQHLVFRQRERRLAPVKSGDVEK
jgi:hypothetical protein